MEMQLPPDFKEFLALLNLEKIEYLLVGGYAVGFHGYPRPTGDLDVWVAVHSDNISKLLNVLAQFGFANAGATPELFLTPGRVVRMGVPPLRIEVINRVSGVEFSQCHARCIKAILDGVPVNVIGREDLLVNKRAAAREKDLSDVKQLEKRRKT
jgi:predicted nucleotidyltransferase